MPHRLRKISYFLLCFLLIFEQSGFAQVVGQLDISGYITGLRSSLIQDKFRPLHLRYLSYDNLNNTFKLLLDKGDYKELKSNTVEQTTKELLNYFFVGITLPNDSFWVNLRPDSPDNIIDPALAVTDVGRILLEADLQLKKDIAKFTSPETPEGKNYWDKLYKKAEELIGYENITIPTLTRPWIVPGEIIIREAEDNAYIYKATLKVCLEQDYLKDSATYNFKDERLKQLNEYSSQLIRELIIPKLTKEVNNAKRYASLRQVYYSLILAQWFKQKFYGKGGFYSSLIDKKNLNGLTSKTAWSKTTYFKEYQKSFNDGEYNIQEPVSSIFGKGIRTYFSGGISFMGEAIKAGFGLGGRITANPKKLELPQNDKQIKIGIKGSINVNDPSNTELRKVEVKEESLGTIAVKNAFQVGNSAQDKIGAILNDLRYFLRNRAITNVDESELNKLAQRIHEAQLVAGGKEVIVVNLAGINIPGISEADSYTLGMMGMGGMENLGRKKMVEAAGNVNITREMIQDWKRSVEKGREALRKGDLDTALRIYKEMRQLRSKLDSDTENTVWKLAGNIREVMEERYKEDKLDVDSLLKRVDIEEIAGEIIQNGVLRGAESAAELTTELSEIIKVKLGQYAQTKVGKASGGYDFSLAFLLMHWHPCEHSGFIKLSDTDIDYNPENRWVMAIWGTEFDGTGFYATVYDKKTKETRYYALLPEDYNLPITRIQGYRFSRIDEKEAREKEQKIKTNQQNISKDQTKTIFWASYNETAAEYKGKDNLINEVEKAIQELVEDRVIEIENKNGEKFQAKGFFELLDRKIPKDYQYDFYAYREIFRQKTILVGRLAALFKTRKTAQEGGEQSKNKQIDSWEVFFNEAMPWHFPDIFGAPTKQDNYPAFPLTGTPYSATLGAQASHIKNLDRLLLILNVLRKSENVPEISENASDREIIEFCINELKAQGLIEEIIDEYGNKIIKIKKEAENNRLAQAIREWVIDKDGGVKAINFQASDDKWNIVGFEAELNNKDTLEHEQKEIVYRKQGYSWIDAHNMAGGQIEDYKPISKEEREVALKKYADMSEAEFGTEAIFHGTNRDFEGFVINELDGEWTMGKGIYFTDNYEQAMKYASIRVKNRGGKTNVVNVRLVRNNLLDCRNGVPEDIADGWLKYIEEKWISNQNAKPIVQNKARGIFEYINYRRINKQPIYLRGHFQPDDKYYVSVDGMVNGFNSDFTQFLQELGYDGVKDIEGGEQAGDIEVGNHVSIVIFDTANIVTYDGIKKYRESQSQNSIAIGTVPVQKASEQSDLVSKEVLPIISQSEGSMVRIPLEWSPPKAHSPEWVKKYYLPKLQTLINRVIVEGLLFEGKEYHVDIDEDGAAEGFLGERLSVSGNYGLMSFWFGSPYLGIHCHPAVVEDGKVVNILHLPSPDDLNNNFERVVIIWGEEKFGFYATEVEVQKVNRDKYSELVKNAENREVAALSNLIESEAVKFYRIEIAPSNYPIYERLYNNELVDIKPSFKEITTEEVLKAVYQIKNNPTLILEADQQRKRIWEKLYYEGDKKDYTLEELSEQIESTKTKIDELRKKIEGIGKENNKPELINLKYELAKREVILNAREKAHAELVVVLPSLVGQALPVIGQAEGGMVTPDILKEWIREGDIPKLAAHIARGLQGQNDNIKNEQINLIINNLEENKRNEFMQALKEKGIVMPAIKLEGKQDKGPGGIDFRAMPIVTQPIQPTLGPVPLGAQVRPLMEAVPENLDKEWEQIQNMLNAGMVPSSQRIKDYLQGCCQKKDFSQDIDKVLSCIADILRLEEERVSQTEPAIKEFLVLLESDKQANEIQLSLSKVTVLPGEPRAVGF